MKYDVIVIGGGPTGMMAAGRAGQLGQSVLLLEKNKELGVKLLMTGKNRCNVTHFTEDKNELIDAYGKNGRFLYSSFSRFGNKEVMEFFESKGVKLKVERGQRVFPVSDKSSDIRNVLLGFLQKNGVEIRTKATVVGIESKVSNEASKAGASEAGPLERAKQAKGPASGERTWPLKISRNKAKGPISDERSNKQIITEIALSSGERLKAKKYIITTGGLSYPATGSTGDGYDWARELGHNIINPRPALSPIVVSEWFIPQLEGLSLKNIELSIYKNDNPPQADQPRAIKEAGKKVESKFGEMLFTNMGVSGPVVLDLSKKVGELMEEEISIENIKLRIDLKPALDFKKLDQRIQRDFQNGNNKQFKNILEDLLPKKFIPVMILKSKIDPEKQVNLITKEERKRLVKLMKGFSLQPDKLFGFGKAIITTGGVDLKEIDSKTMQSRLIKNLYFAGEVLDLDGPTGGYNLQIAWSTGYAAGTSTGK